MNLSVEIPDDVVEQWGADIPSAEARLRLELAIHLYASRSISMGRAADISGVTRQEFEERLNASGIVRNYGRGYLLDEPAVVDG